MVILQTSNGIGQQTEFSVQKKEDQQIDFVLAWVDGSDPDWQRRKAQIVGGASADDGVFRYREWGLLPYWFRGVEKFAPWVRKIHFICDQEPPAWLNTDHPKLHIVRHEDYLPDVYRPAFSSHPIELNMHRIPGLSEQFVYYNARKSESSTSIDGGCSLFSAVKTMAMEGVCSEELFPYNPDCYTAKPPLEAYSDAENRKVVKAKSVKRNLNDLKSAVFEGYPVAISLKIFDSFNPNRGFIPMPSDEEIAEIKKTLEIGDNIVTDELEVQLKELIDSK